MKAIRKRVKPPPLTAIIALDENNNLQSGNSDSKSISPADSTENQTNNLKVEENEESLEQKEKQKTRVFEKKRPRQKTENTFSTFPISKNSEDLNNLPSSSNSDSEGIQLQVLNPFTPNYLNYSNNYNSNSCGSTSISCSTTSIATTSTTLPGSQVFPLSIAGSQLSLISKVMDKIEKGEKADELYPALPKEANR